MSKLPFSLVLITIVFSLPILAYTQKSSNWKSIENKELLSRSNQTDRLLPTQYASFELIDSRDFGQQLATAPLRFSEKANNERVEIEIPMPDGSLEIFRIFDAPVMTDELAVKFPKIKTYTAVGVTNPNAKAKIDFSPHGFHAMIFAIGKNPVFVDPDNVNEQTYISYYKKHFQHERESFRCGVTGRDQIWDPEEIITRSAGDCQLREYLLALACTGEYAQYHDDGDDTNGDIIDDVMAAMTTTMNRVNGVFETDAGLTMVMVDNTDIIFTDGSTDPYSNGSGGAMLGQNQTTCDNEIGSSNYDIGHVFSTGGGGVAYLNAPCNNNIKAGGVTGQGSPVGDPFDIDYVAHEMGHQYGGRHTQNNSCNRDGTSSYEPGSASTIMGYAGICNPNVESNSDAYFHAISVQQFGNFTTGSGNSCASIINTTNNPPTADAGANYTIPISTPFVLTGVGTDADNDDLTYCWEQWDREVASMPPVSTSTSGPAFRSFEPKPDPRRYFPRLSVLSGSGSDEWEVLPSVNRDLNFRLTVRDNNSAYGCTEEDDMVVTSSNTSGPFLVTYPNTELDWDIGTTETITWDVANTNIAPVSCANVDIFYSTDGGLSFPNTLVLNTPNDGSQPVTVPDVATSLFRIMIKCSDNIFFDISNQNVSIGVETVCVTFNSADVPISISSSGTPTITSELPISLGEIITDLNILNLEGTHSYLGDLRFTLINPDSDEVILINRECGTDEDFDISFDDEGGSPTCPYNDGQTTAPVNSLANFNGGSTDGTWILEIADLADNDGGELTAWSIQICYDQPDGALPLDLLSFEANPKSETILLNWETANEINNQGFEIQKRASNQDDFLTIGWQDGLGNAFRGSYTFEDTDVLKGIDYYYRLKQVDYDGEYEFSDIAVTRLNVKELQVSIAPNPAESFINISLIKENQHAGTISIIDILGKTIQNQTFEMEDQIIIPIDLNNFPNGVYYVQIVLKNEETITEKFVKK